MTSSIFNSTQLKATLLGSFRARGGRPDPAKLLKAILMCRRTDTKRLIWFLYNRYLKMIGNQILNLERVLLNQKENYQQVRYYNENEL